MVTVTETLIKLAISPSYKGFDYIQKALELLKKDPHKPIITLYKEVASHFDGATYPRVERCIRHCVEVMLKQGDPWLINTIFGQLRGRSTSITNSHFLHSLRIYLAAH